MIIATVYNVIWNLGYCLSGISTYGRLMSILDIDFNLNENPSLIAWIKQWPLDEVWSRENYEKLKPVEFLHQGESAVNDFEQLLAAAADRTYGELLSPPDPGRSLPEVLTGPDSARQIALLKGRVKTCSTGEAAAKLYKHGGLSLMEMLTPWIELAIA